MAQLSSTAEKKRREILNIQIRKLITNNNRKIKKYKNFGIIPAACFNGPNVLRKI